VVSILASKSEFDKKSSLIILTSVWTELYVTVVVMVAGRLSTMHSQFWRVTIGVDLFKMLVGSDCGTRLEGPQPEARGVGVLGGTASPLPTS